MGEELFASEIFAEQPGQAKDMVEASGMTGSVV